MLVLCFSGLPESAEKIGFCLKSRALMMYYWGLPLRKTSHFKLFDLLFHSLFFCPKQRKTQRLHHVGSLSIGQGKGGPSKGRGERGEGSLIDANLLSVRKGTALRRDHFPLRRERGEVGRGKLKINRGGS